MTSRRDISPPFRIRRKRGGEGGVDGKGRGRKGERGRERQGEGEEPHASSSN